MLLLLTVRKALEKFRKLRRRARFASALNGLYHKHRVESLTASRSGYVNEQTMMVYAIETMSLDNAHMTGELEDAYAIDLIWSLRLSFGKLSRRSRRRTRRHCEHRVNYVMLKHAFIHIRGSIVHYSDIFNAPFYHSCFPLENAQFSTSSLKGRVTSHREYSVVVNSRVTVITVDVTRIITPRSTRKILVARRIEGTMIKFSLTTNRVWVQPSISEGDHGGLSTPGGNQRQP